MRSLFSKRLVAVLFSSVCLGAAHAIPPAISPLEPASTGGLATVDRALARLQTHQRLLVIAAHPDDEDTALLTWVARGLGGEAAYLSLSRGEGGQNLIGSELGEGERPQAVAKPGKLDDERPDKDLMNGPQMPDSANSQDDIDALLASFD